MATKSNPVLVRATTTFHAPDNVTVNEGELFESTDALVKKYGSFFVPADQVVRRSVETAVARPGVARGAD